MSLLINTLLVVALGLSWAGIGVMSLQSPWLILAGWGIAHAVQFAILYALVSTGVLDVSD